jgi:hypothetical protein
MRVRIWIVLREHERKVQRGVWANNVEKKLLVLTPIVVVVGVWKREGRGGMCLGSWSSSLLPLEVERSASSCHVMLPPT